MIDRNEWITLKMAGRTVQRHIAPLMRHGRIRVAGALAAAALATACDLDVAPPPPIPPVDITLDFCSDETPIWVGYLNLGQNWVRVTPDANGTVTFTAEYRVAIGMVRANGSDIRTELIYTTSNVLAAVSDQNCNEESGTKALTGTVINFTGTQRALVGMGVSSVYRLPGQNSFTLANLPTRALDLMASRMTFNGTLEQHANKTILRRSTNFQTGTSITPALDFDASEAFSPTTANVPLSGINTDDYAFLTNNFFSQLGTSHILTYVEPVGNGAHQVEAIPVAQSAAGEYHEVFVTVVSPAGHLRGAERFFRTPASHLLEVGPELSEPSVSSIATTPTLRLRTQLPLQTDYPSAITVEYNQQLQFSANKYTITVTAGFFGTSFNTWDIPMDDMGNAPGWQNSWGLQNGAYDWTVTAYGVRSALLLGAPPIENELTRFAVRNSDPTALLRQGPNPAGQFSIPHNCLVRTQCAVAGRSSLSRRPWR